VSLDGDPAANEWRYDKQGAPSHAAVRTALELLTEHKLEVGIISVVTRHSLGRAAEIIEHLSGYRCVRVVKFVPCFDIGVRQGAGPVRSKRTLDAAAQVCAGEMPWATTPHEFSQFLIAAWRSWLLVTTFGVFSSNRMQRSSARHDASR